MGRSSREERKSTRPTWETLETWVRVKVQEFLQAVLEEEVTEAGGGGTSGATGSTRQSGIATATGSRDGSRCRPGRSWFAGRACAASRSGSRVGSCRCSSGGVSGWRTCSPSSTSTGSRRATSSWRCATYSATVRRSACWNHKIVRTVALGDGGRLDLDHDLRLEEPSDAEERAHGLAAGLGPERHQLPGRAHEAIDVGRIEVQADDVGRLHAGRLQHLDEVRPGLARLRYDVARVQRRTLRVVRGLAGHVQDPLTTLHLDRLVDVKRVEPRLRIDRTDFHR